MTQSALKIYQIKMSLKGAKPPIWRRVLVKNTTPLDGLHDIIQHAMGWTDSHLHQFIVGHRFYGVPDPEWGFDEVLDERKYKINELLKKEKDTIVYEYDFGDGWEHVLLLEKVLPFDSEQPLPICIAAKRACPPEDIGGIWGYEDFLDALEDTSHPEHQEYKSWSEESFDPAVCDIHEINENLAKNCR